MCRKGIFLTTQRAGTAKMPLSSFVLPIIDNGMKAETPSFEAHQFVRVRRGDAVRRLIQRDKTPLAVLFMAAVVGTLAGLVGVAFEKSVNWVQNQRIGALAQVADHWYLVWPLAFILSALLAGILFIIEEMRPQFRYNLISIKAVFTGVIMSSIVFRIFNGEAAIIEVGKLSNAPVNTLWLYLVLGMLFGCFGPLFNFLVLRTQDLFQRIHGGNIKKWVFIGGLIGGLCGLLGLMQPSAVGGGFNLIPIAAAGNFSVGLLLFIFIARVVTTLICFSSGAPGGIFAPMLALGTLLGTAFGMAAIPLFPAYHLDAGTFAIAGMGALLAASVRAPLTGIVLVLEMTDNYQLILPMIITCLGATLLAQFLGGKPLYSTILQRTLAKQEAEQAAKAQQAPRENT